jgi:hypothetical protein
MADSGTSHPRDKLLKKMATSAQKERMERELRKREIGHSKEQLARCRDACTQKWHDGDFFLQSKLHENKTFFAELVQATNRNKLHQKFYEHVKVVNDPEKKDLAIAKIICVGDLHGDLVHFLHILLDYKLISIADYNHDESDDAKLRQKITEPGFLRSLGWKRKDVLVLCLGDLCDDQRVSSSEQKDNEGSKYKLLKRTSVNNVIEENSAGETQFFVMEYLLHITIAYLRLLALKKKSNILFVFGNHELETIIAINSKLCKKYVSRSSFKFFTSYSQRAEILGIFYTASPLFAAHVQTAGPDTSLCVSHSGVRDKDDCDFINELQQMFDLNKIAESQSELQKILRPVKKREIWSALSNFLWHRDFTRQGLLALELAQVRNIGVFAAGHTYSCDLARPADDQEAADGVSSEESNEQKCRKCGRRVTRTLQYMVNETVSYKDDVSISEYLPQYLPQPSPTDGGGRKNQTPSGDTVRMDREIPLEQSQLLHKTYFFIDTHISSCFLKKEVDWVMAESISFTPKNKLWKTKTHTFKNPGFDSGYSFYAKDYRADPVQGLTDEYFSTEREAQQYYWGKTA